jgi:hypothetical protein
MPLQATSGAASYDAFGGGVPVAVNYIEDVFSTFLYKGNSSAQTITNGIDLSGKGGLLWCKGRDIAEHNNLFDTARGNGYIIRSNNTQVSDGPFFGQTFTSSGFTLNTTDNQINSSSNNYVSWTFRKQPKFFDVVTYTGTGANRTVSHSLGSTPGCIFIKQTSDPVENWIVYHRSYGAAGGAFLNTDDQFYDDSTYFNNTAPTSTNFTLSTAGQVNTNGETYVAYLFAHDAGGFGLTGTDNVISCGSLTTDGSGNATVSLGWEPQWFLVKKSSGVGNWFLADTMRGFTPANPAGSDTFNYVSANLVDTEAGGDIFRLNSTGFNAVTGVASETYIYIAIRKGPMKVPTVGTSVFGLSARTGTGANATVTGGQTDDAVLVKNRGSAVASLFASRLTGKGYLVTSSTAAEVAAGATIFQQNANAWDVMNGVKVGTTSTIVNASGNTFINYLFRRAPSFFDVVCYTGNATAGRTVNHNLGVVPQMMIFKQRNGANSFRTYVEPLGNTSSVVLNSTSGLGTDASFNNTTPTSSVFTVGSALPVNGSGYNYVAYLFATCAGVSKVGSYTGTATTLQIDCGFTGGARFILIKRTDDVGDWYVWDTARGIVSGNDPYLLLNSTAAEVTSTDYIDTYSAGFEISSTAPDAINASGGTFIFLAIA